MFSSKIDPRSTLITAGPTREPVDAVRYLSNRSSGRMGVAMAIESARRGRPTTLLAGPVSVEIPSIDGLSTHRFETTAELLTLLETHFPQCAMLVMAAAVADFIPRRLSRGKASRLDGFKTVRLEPAPDLLKTMAGIRRPGQRLIGFALEHADQLTQRATAKMVRKGIDAIVANPMETMESDDTSAALLLADGTALQAEPNIPKAAFAHWLWDELEREFAPDST